MLSQIVDVLIFITVAFYGVFPIAELDGTDDREGGLSALLVPPAVYLCSCLVGNRPDRIAPLRGRGRGFVANYNSVNEFWNLFGSGSHGLVLMRL